MRSSSLHGFTLLELLVAITLAGVVALLVYGTADAGRQTQQRLAERRRAVQTTRAFRSTVEDALRNTRPTRVYGDTAFWLEARRDSRNRPMDRLWFVTAGSMPPLTPDADWEVSIEPAPDGVVMTATPVGIAAPTRVVVRYPDATGLEIRVLDFGSPPVWTNRWRFPSFVPAAIELTYWGIEGPISAPVRLALPLGSSR